MSKPIFVDPVLDGAADPVVIRNRESGEWWMFYTNRRANLGTPGGGWIQGSPIGYAVSADKGLSWEYRGQVKGLDDPNHPGLNTHWAPEIIWGLGEYHMYLSYTEGAPEHFDVERQIVHYTSPNLVDWTRRGILPLNSQRVIDACGGNVAGKTIAVLGLTFKPNTDDMRESPSLVVLPALIGAGARVQAFDPEGMQESAKLMPHVHYCTSAYDAMADADAVLILTEWNEFRALDLARVRQLLRQPVIVDLRNIYSPQDMAAAGFVYTSIGRPADVADSAGSTDKGNAA